MIRGETLPTEDVRLPLVSGIAAQTAEAALHLRYGEPDLFHDRVTPVTAELLDWWFHEDGIAARAAAGEPNFHDGQRDAILAVIYGHEVLGATSLPDLYDKVLGEEWARRTDLDAVDRTEIDADSSRHPKYAIKLATGTGKTWVLNALLVWQYLNALAAPGDRRFTRNFLIVAPGLIVYDRLLDSFLGKPDAAGQRDWHTSDLYANRTLFIPERHRERVLQFVRGAAIDKTQIGRRTTPGGVIAITNWHLLAGRDKDVPDFLPDEDEPEVAAPGAAPDVKAVAQSFLPVVPGTAAGNSLERLDRQAGRGLEFEWLRDLPDLLVFNDEAHHVHKVRRGGIVEPLEWQRALDEIGAPKGDRFTQVDFTATPYAESGTRQKNRRYFPHIVVNFDLRLAIQQGLVKSIAIDKRNEIGALPTEALDFRADRDDEGRLIVSNGQTTMLAAGLTKLQRLETDFARVDPTKHPKLLVLAENTEAAKAIERHLSKQGVPEEEMLRIDSDRKGELKDADWQRVKQRLTTLDTDPTVRIVISVLMLREGFDVNSICVIVPLRASESGILLEQVIGRGLRLMWRGDPDIDAAKAENRRLIAEGREPTTRYDLLSIVEHPAYEEFYRRELGDGLFTNDPDETGTGATGDIERVDLRDDFERFDIAVPIVIHDAEEELAEPTIDIDALPVSTLPYEQLRRSVGHGERFASEDVMVGTRYGEYVVDAGSFTAASYSEYLARIAAHIDDLAGRARTASGERSRRASAFPVLQVSRPTLVAWLDRYVRTRLFARPFDPLTDENWRMLVLPGMVEQIAGVFIPALVAQLDRVDASEAVVQRRMISEAGPFTASARRLVPVRKCVYERLRVLEAGHGGGLERRFIEWADQDTAVEAFCRIDERRHDWLQRPYLKDNGHPARYSPDFIVRTAGDVYVVETKAQTGLSDANVQRKRRAALTWVERINTLPETDRDGLEWHYALVGEQLFGRYRDANASILMLLDQASLRSAAAEDAQLF